MMSCTGWLLLLSGAAFCNAFHSLYPMYVGVNDEDPFMPKERDALDDCHLRYLRYGRDDLKPQTPLPPYEENREYSHVAAIGWTRSSGEIDWACMGTLIWDNFVLTSAHCTMDESNTAPDVVRLGEANPAHMQQRKISHIARHPEFAPQTERNDIALLQLDKRIIVNQTVAPGCMWLAPETIFPKLQSLVRSKVDANNRNQGIPVISSVESAQTNGRKCVSSTSGDGELLCIEPGESEPTKCLDAPAGNPLQVRLLHNYKTSPFVVGIRAGSHSATSCKPAGAYTRIGSYATWITQVLAERNATAKPVDFIPAVCALRFAHLRPRVDELLMERFDEIQTLGLQVEWRHTEDFRYIVRILWPAEAAQAARNDCAGTLVDQSTVLTLAECVAPTPEGHKPTEVLHTGRYENASLPIKSITVHPGYVRGSQANNIAVIKLTKPDGAVPACVWPFDDSMLIMRVDLAGVGASGLIGDIGDAIDDQGGVFPSHHLRAVDYLPWANCTDELTKFNRTLQGVSGEQHVCFRNEQWLVPGSCGLLPGGPLQRYIGRAGSALKYVYALSLAGRSCGHGIPAVALLLRPHVPWLRSVIMEGAPGIRPQATSDSVIVINPDLQRSDECSNGDGTVGICVPHEMCLSTPERLRKGERVTLCSVGSVVCCPWGDIARNAAVNPVRKELESCETRSREFREQRLRGRESNSTEFDNFPHLAEIGWPQSNGRIQFNCIGYLISTNTIVTSARCAEAKSWKPTVARIGMLNSENPSNYLLQPIRRVTVHEEYDDNTGANNLALVQLTAHIKPTVFFFPGCLFSNETHVPALQYGVHYDGASLHLDRIFPMYDGDCRERQPIGETLLQGHMCFLRGRAEAELVRTTRCYTPGDIMVWTRLTEEQIDDAEYLVAIYNHGVCREVDDVLTATRISAYYEWIVNNIK
uniref:Peptidase S1 domain-containing protein n=1 Tax=Anopheles atroparvus TaxID=41427 RepID=A0A182J7I9_ANOAO